MRIIRYLLSSVRFRVTAAAVVAVGCALGVSASLLQVGLEHDRQRVLLTTAQSQARIVEAYNPDLSLPLNLPSASIESGLIQVIRDGRVIGASRPLHSIPPLWAPGDPIVENFDPLAGVSRDVHVVAVPVVFDGVKVDIVVVASLEQFDGSVVFVQQLLEIGIPLLLAVLGLICWMMVGRALRPIEMMRREVDDVATIRGADRLAEPATDDEVGRLARTLNSMLDRIQASSDRERRFVSDASHELRSPIANIRTEIEVALHRPERADWPAVATQVLGQNQRMTDLVEGLLLLARSDEGSLMAASGVTDLASAARGVMNGFDPTGPEVTIDAVPAFVPVPPVYLERMITNLVDNARRFAASGVEITVRADGQSGILEVRDDGPGVPDSQRERIFERFVRLDEARDRVEGGFGLGLAIVADLCRFYGGNIGVTDAQPGARFVLAFPLSPPPENLAPAATDEGDIADAPWRSPVGAASSGRHNPGSAL